MEGVDLAGVWLELGRGTGRNLIFKINRYIVARGYLLVPQFYNCISVAPPNLINLT